MGISVKELNDKITAIENKSQSTGGFLVDVKMAQNGYAKFDNGMIYQWGRGAGYINFPIAFPNECRSIVSSSQHNSNFKHDTVIVSISKTGFRSCYATNTGQSISCNFFAIGYLITYRLLNIYYAYAYRIAHNDLRFLEKIFMS